MVYRGNDRKPLSRVEGLKAKRTKRGVLLSWKPAEDNIAIMLYVVSRDGAGGSFRKVGERLKPSFYDSPGRGRFRYRVLACDFEENLGEWSKPLSVKLKAPTQPPKPTVEEEERKNYREHILEIAQRGREKVNRGLVLCYGDSLTGATSYPFEIQSALGTKRVVACGYQARTTSFGKAHARENFERDMPSIALVLFGTNNRKDAKSVERAMEDLTGIVRTAEEMGIIPVLGTMPPRGFRDPESGPEANYNKALIELCRKLRVPRGHLFEEYQSQPDRRVLLAGDGVHNTVEGMRVSARAWKRAGSQILFILRDRE